MTGFACNLKYQTVKESQRGPAPEVNQRRLNDFRILNRQVTMFEQKLHRQGECRGLAIVKGSEYLFSRRSSVVDVMEE